MGRVPWKAVTALIDDPINDQLDQFLSSNLTDNDLMNDMGHINLDKSISYFTNNESLIDDGLDNWPTILDSPVEDNKEFSFEPRIVQVTNYQQTEDDEDANYSIDIVEMIKQEVESDSDDYSDIVCEKSLFKTNHGRRRLPWEYISDDSDEEPDDEPPNLDLMTVYEENELLNKLRNIFNASKSSNKIISIAPWVRRFYRKLCVRDIKRNSGLSYFDLDNLIKFNKNNDVHILDRYQQIVCLSSKTKSTNADGVPTFSSRLIGSIDYDMFKSPHTGRILHPFIYRNSKILPTWLKVFLLWIWCFFSSYNLLIFFIFF